MGTEADIVVDNSAGGDPEFAAEVARLLSTRGLAVEVRSAPVKFGSTRASTSSRPGSPSASRECPTAPF
jgi:hypothetical protein